MAYHFDVLFADLLQDISVFGCKKYTLFSCGPGATFICGYSESRGRGICMTHLYDRIFQEFRTLLNEFHEVS